MKQSQVHLQRRKKKGYNSVNDDDVVDSEINECDKYGKEINIINNKYSNEIHIITDKFPECIDPNDNFVDGLLKCRKNETVPSVVDGTVHVPKKGNKKIKTSKNMKQAKYQYYTDTDTDTEDTDTDLERYRIPI